MNYQIKLVRKFFNIKKIQAQIDTMVKHRVFVFGAGAAKLRTRTESSANAGKEFLICLRARAR